MVSEAAIAAPIASAIWWLKYGKCQFCGDSTTPSSDTSSDAITFLIGASSDSMSRPTFGKLSIPVTHSFASANFQELRNGEVVRRIHLPRGWVNKASAWAPSVAVWQDARWKRSVEEAGMSMRRAIVLSVMMAAALVVASGLSHLRFRVLQ